MMSASNSEPQAKIALVLILSIFVMHYYEL